MNVQRYAPRGDENDTSTLYCLLTLVEHILPTITTLEGWKSKWDKKSIREIHWNDEKEAEVLRVGNLD
jgi:hypothetical protein